MIKYDKLWLTMQERGITKYTLHKEYHFSKSLIHRLQNNEGVSMNTINTCLLYTSFPVLFSGTVIIICNCDKPYI